MNERSHGIVSKIVVGVFSVCNCIIYRDILHLAIKEDWPGVIGGKGYGNTRKVP